jgi:signal transduction histidine kinase
VFASRAYLAVTLPLIGIYFAFPAGGTAQSTIYELLGGAAVLAIVYAVRLHRPEHRLPWLLFAGGNALFVIGDVISIFLSDPPVPSPADVFYLAGYPLVAVGLLLLMLAAGARNRRGALADAAIFTLGFALLQWIFLMGPVVRGAGSRAEHVVSGLYPGMDVVLLAGFAGFFVSPAWRTPAFRYLVGGVLALLLGDEIYGLDPGGYASGDWIDFAWMLSYALWAAAALHPSMRELSQARREAPRRVAGSRIVVLAAALVTVPVVLLVQQLRGKPLDIYVVVAIGSGISLLVVARLTGILRTLERIRGREQAARTLAEEAQAQLMAQNERLVEADRLKDEFVALISHDLRTPLTSIVGYIELAMDDELEPPLDEERRSYLEVVSRSSERLLRLVDDLLFIARLQAGRLVLEPGQLDLCTIVAQSVEESRPRAEAKGVALSFLGSGAVMIEGDKGRIFQLLDNLISNAIKFTPAGGRIDVRAVPKLDGAVLEVSDTGIGLAPGEAELVFDRFFRSSQTAAQQTPGTGLGLFIARAITEAHGGQISAGSREGEGTTFRIELPAELPPQAESDAAGAELVA